MRNPAKGLLELKRKKKKDTVDGSVLGTSMSQHKRNTPVKCAHAWTDGVRKVLVRTWRTPIFAARLPHQALLTLPKLHLAMCFFFFVKAKVNI